MTEQKVIIYISERLKEIPDQAFAEVLRRLIFDGFNAEKATELVERYMPEQAENKSVTV